MGFFFSKMKEPEFLKESGNAEAQLEKLKALDGKLNEEGQKILYQDITCLEYGIAGEKNILFELKNSHMPMVVLHDIYFVCGDLSAQMDFMVFTPKICFVLECKNLYGNISIDANGNFVRTMYFGTRKVQEGIYSPVTQNERHLELMRQMKQERKMNALFKWAALRSFSDTYKSVVVLANPKTILNDRYAKKEVKNCVIRADQLVQYIKDTCAASKEEPIYDDMLRGWARSYLYLNQENPQDYLEKYKKYYRQDGPEKQSLPDGTALEETAGTGGSEKGKTGSNTGNPQTVAETNHICPRCGGRLVLRTAKNGQNAGNRFYGCINFPKCRYTRNILESF